MTCDQCGLDRLFGPGRCWKCWRAHAKRLQVERSHWHGRFEACANELADVTGDRNEAVALLSSWLSMLPTNLDMGRLPYAKLRRDSQAAIDARAKATTGTGES